MMKIKHILFTFLLINIIVASDICAMEQPNKQKTEQPSLRPYPSNLPALIFFGWDKSEESYLNKLPLELIVKIINHTRGIKNGQYLLNAVKANHKDEVERLLKEAYIDVNVKDENDYTPLIWAAISNDSGIVKILLDKAGNLNVQDKYGSTPLSIGVRNNNSEIVQLLLAKGANLNIEDQYGQVPLNWAVIERNTEIVQMLLNNGANPNMQGVFRSTALHWAVKSEKPKIVQILLDNGANPNIQNKYRRTALHLAIKKKNQAIINLIIKAKEKLDYTSANIGTSGS